MPKYRRGFGSVYKKRNVFYLKGQRLEPIHQDILTDEEKEIEELGETFKRIYRATKHGIVREAMKQYVQVLKELDNLLTGGYQARMRGHLIVIEGEKSKRVAT